jgi:hypothetical protein
MITLVRYVGPEHVANLDLLLASNKASCIIGKSINITGEIEVQ